MAFIKERYLFSWRDFDDWGGLEGLKIVLEHMPYEKLVPVFIEIKKYDLNEN